MPVVAMAETAEPEPGAPVGKNAIDPDLVKLKRKPPKVGAITAAGIVFLSLLFLLRLNADRKFSGSSEPAKVAVSDVLAGNVATERFITLDASAEPLLSHAIRTTTTKGSLGLRLVPIRGSGDRLWLALAGDGWDQPQLGGYVGRLRAMRDLPFAAAADDYLATHPQPTFAAASAVRAGFAAGKVTAVSGEQLAPHDGDRVAFDVTDPDAAIVVATFDEKLRDVAAWRDALAQAGVTVHGEPQATTEVARFEVAEPNAAKAVGDKLAKASLWAARVEPVTHHHETTWGALKGSSPAGFVAGNATVPDAQLDLIGLYTTRELPADAYALITSELPADYWYVLPVTIVVGAIALLFLWALVRAIRRDVLTPEAS